ncbi:glycosyl transferase family protein [Rhizoctonia solani]|uniref:Glycosyl transferase family protein n=1 Tax=Rhizoctonia solani TaxID=456999 RepID=A0A0K6GFN3_9AGAM|nr:glycosyl transferase family protein [Rhizoctonia solani]
MDRGWRTLDWKTEKSYPWNGDCPNYELAGGVFARGRSTLPDSSQIDMDDVHHFTAAIDVIVFPSRDGTQSVSGWSHERVGILVHDFTIAPEEDLVVLVGHRHEGAVDEPIPIHLRTLSSNKHHPMATLPVLFAHPQPPDVFISDFTIQIYNSLLGILFWGSHAFHLMIWDWCAGEIIVDYPAPAGIHFDDFSFLSDSSFLIPSSSAAGAALRIYSFAHLLPPSHPSYEPLYQGTNPARPFADFPIGRAPHHLEFDNSGRRVAPACWTPQRPGVTVRSFHMGNHIFCVSHLGEHHRSNDTAPAGLSGLTRRPLLRSLLRFPKPKREWNVGIMTCRVDPLPRYELRHRTSPPEPQKKDKGKGKEEALESEQDVREEGQEEEEEDIPDGDETRFAPRRAFHADPDRAIIALSSGLVPVRSGVFAGVVYLDEGSLAWEEGERSEEGSGRASTSQAASSSSSSSTDPPLAGTLVPWIDLHMPPSSIPIPTEPPLMSVFDHSSESSGHEPIQIQIHDATIGEEGGGVAAAAAAYSHGPQPSQLPATLPPDPLPQTQDEDVPNDDLDRLYFNLFVHVGSLRRFAEPQGVIVDRRTHRPRVYEWDGWAPPITRLLTRMPMPAWACISHGQRFATLGVVGEGAEDPQPSVQVVQSPGGTHQHLVVVQPPQPEPMLEPWMADGPGGANFKRPVRVLDFNPYSVRRKPGSALEDSTRNKVRVVDGPSTLKAGNYWESDVVSCLPYREVVTREEMLLSGVMIDGERVLGMRSDERGNVSEMYVMQV